MTENSHPDLSAQFRELGQNLKNLMQSAWESDEARNFKEEIKEGFIELGSATEQAVTEFNMSEAGRSLKSEAEAFRTRLESGELETKTRQEISKALNIINTELQKVIENFTPSANDPEV
jgi:hypothetical protein